MNNFHIEGVFSYARNQYDNRRHTTIGGLQRTASSDDGGDTYSASLAGGDMFRLENWMLQPFVSLNYVYLDEEGFEETGAGTLNLSVDDRQTDSFTSQLGLRLVHEWIVGDGVLIPEMSAAWLHDFAVDDNRITSSFAGSPGTAFAVEGRESEEDGLRVGAGIAYVGSSGFSTAANSGAIIWRTGSVG